MNCPHDDFVILGSNRLTPMPSGTCKKCGEELPLYVLLNNWKERIEREIAAIRSGKQGE